jgi:hypothetical protein
MMTGEVVTTQSTLARPASDAAARSNMWLGPGATLAFAIFIIWHTPTATRPEVRSTIVTWATLVLLALLYWRGYVLLNSSGAGALRTVIVFGMVFALMGLVSPPFDSPQVREI